MRYFGIALVALALVAAVVPQFTACDGLLQLANGKTTFMKCHWTALAELGVAVPLVAVGSMMTVFSRRKQTAQVLSIMGIVLGAFVVMLPNNLIGVCTTPTMICHTTMQPALTAVGGLVVGLSLVGMVISSRKKE
jgi:hypothetical protein